MLRTQVNALSTATVIDMFMQQILSTGSVFVIYEQFG